MKESNGKFRYCIVLKHKHILQNPSKNINFSFKNNGEIFKVCFNIDRIIFIFNPTFKIQKNKTSNEKSILQKSIRIIEKIDIFSKCPEITKEKSNLHSLYSDSVDFFN